MTTHPTSLIDILFPPVNPWLMQLLRRESMPAEGVRVVRFNTESDDDEGAELATKPSTSPRKRKDVSNAGA